MRDIILIPTYRRPEYLYVCLQHILAAHYGSVQREIIVQHDKHIGEPAIDLDLTRKAVTVVNCANITFKEIQAHRTSGNSHNVFSLYRQALAMPDVRFIYLIEDDVIVAEDFFKWHELVRDNDLGYGQSNLFATVGWKCIRNAQVVFNDDPSAIILSDLDYASIGVCWTPEKLAEFVAHDTVEYHENPSKYLAKAFPGNPIPAWQWTEQDGIITRMLAERRGRVVAWPVRPRCAHIGISGYHRQAGHRFEGTLTQRINALQAAVATPGRLAGLSKDPFNDVFALPPVEPFNAWDLHVAHRFVA